MKFIQRFFTLFVLLITVSAISAETFRTHNTINLQMPDLGDMSCVAGINDMIIIALPSDTTFLQAIELEIKIPDLVAQYRDSVAYSFYTEVKPLSSGKRIDYSGKRQMIETLPSRLSLNLTFPLTQEHSIKQSPYTTVLPVVYKKNDNIYLRFQLVMKGIPESFDDEKLVVTAKPIFIDKGQLLLDMKYPLDSELKSIEKPYSIFIDEKPVTTEDGKLILDTGRHHLSIISDFYRNETRTFTIEQAQNTTVQIQLRDIAPTLQLAIPEGTIVLFDGNPIENIKDSFIIEQGEHTLHFVVGDYEITKVIQAVNGRSYTMNLSMNIDVTETQ